ncbi:MAG: ABC transporter ATP-binding protein [Clostridiales bacterium]|nr:ABC transporter ATP-binding protein [Clostridiales bacterium]
MSIFKKKKHAFSQPTGIPAENVLVTQALTKTYFQGDHHIKAVDGAYLTVRRGEFVSIVGASGSGKSTLLQLAAGLDQPTAGRVYIGGRDIYDMDDDEFSDFRNKRIGFIFQTFNLLPVLTAKENILMPQKIAGSTHYPYYFDELTKLLKINDRLHHLPSELSGGQQQRVAAARALINKPDILFADEPTGNLDAESAHELIELLLATRAELNQTLVLVTHDQKLAERADRIYTMDNGVLSERKSN